jgi:predicted unusual protein kinase regulating ubiquinone biosynthesis (AarF/ABC1/UbiB family)
MAKTKDDRARNSQDAPQAPAEHTATSPSLEGKTTQGNRERLLEILLERHIHFASSFDARMRKSHLIVPTDHPTHRQLQSSLEEAAKMLPLGGAKVKLVIFARYPAEELEDISMEETHLEAYLPEAFANPVTGTVYLSVPFLEALEYDTSRINSVMYHELAHLVLMRGIMEELSSSIIDPLGQSIRDYDVEYHCDRIADLISSRRGEDPRNIGKALAAIESAEKEILQRSKLDPSEIISGGGLPLLSTHPATPRRIRANERLSRQLPVPPAGFTSAPPLEPINRATLPITRPCGELIKTKNYFDNITDGISPRLHFDLNQDWQLSKIILNKEDYRNWCGELDEEKHYEIIPVEINTLLKDLSINSASDWLTEFAILASYLETPLWEVLEGFLQELQNVKLDDAETILKNIDPSRLVSNHQEPNKGIMTDSALPLCLSPIIGRYLHLKSEQGSSSIQSLQDLVEIGRQHEIQFGSSVIFSAREIKALVIDICEKGTASEHKQLVDTISKNPSLAEALSTKTKDDDSSPLSKALATLEQLLEKYGPFEKEEEKHQIPKYSMCAQIVPFYMDYGVKQPTVMRRVPNAEFSVTELQRPGNTAPIMVIQLGDAPLRDDDMSAIRNAFLDRFKKRFKAQDLHPRMQEELNKILEKVNYHAQELQSYPVPSLRQTEAFITTQLAADYAKSISATANARRIGQYLFYNQIQEIFSATSTKRQIYDIGEEETTRTWMDPGRSEYSANSYASSERSSFELFQILLIFNDHYRSSFDQMLPGVAKAQFLISMLPIKFLERDQLLCKALGFPPLDCMNDMASIEQRIITENDISTLHILRSELKNEGLALVAEDRLYELCNKDRDTFLAHPTIQALMRDLFASLPEGLREVVAQDEQLLTILLAFTQPSRQRDKQLIQFIDEANSRALKEALGGLLVDPIMSDISPNIGRGSRVSLDTILSLLPHLSSYDKAQAILYFMGFREFRSPTATWLLNPKYAETTLAELQKKLTLTAPKNSSKTGTNQATVEHKFALPDCLVRAQRLFGISVSTAENLQSSLLNERGITDLLTTILYGESGIVHDDKVRKEFFFLAGRTLIQTSERLNSLDLKQREALAMFLAFAFEECPLEKLPTVIMRVWEATKGKADQLPSVLTSILRGLGPAFVKFGQKLATLNISADYKKAFRELSSENREVDSTLFYHNIEAIFGKPTFDQERSGCKLGEGSMAATFKALPKGASAPLAIKMIQPSIESEIESDCAYIAKLVAYINSNKPFGSLTLPTNTAAIIQKQLRQQIDTEAEQNNSKALASALSPASGVVNFRVAKIDENLSPRGVIAAEFLPGHELDSPRIEQQGYDSKAIRNEVGLEALRLLLTASVYQSDVNLGNFGVLKDPDSDEIITTDGRPTVVWYDAGAVEKITADDQKLLLTIIKSAKTDPASLPQQLSKLIKNAKDGAERIGSICQDLAREWTDSKSFAPELIKDKFDRFFDKVSEAGLEIEERWLIIANTISMAAPLLASVKPQQLEELVVKALEHHNMLTMTEKIMLRFGSFLK